MYSLLALFFISGLCFYRFNGYNAIVTRYRKFRELNKLVSSQYKTITMILWVSFCMVAKMYWIRFLQWANNTVVYLDNKTAIVSYVLNGKLYRIVLKQRRGPCNILLVTDEENNDVSEEIISYMGPSQDWHGREFTPNFWKKNSLTFETGDGMTKTFTNNEIITI